MKTDKQIENSIQKNWKNYDLYQIKIMTNLSRFHVGDAGIFDFQKLISLAKERRKKITNFEEKLQKSKLVYTHKKEKTKFLELKRKQKIKEYECKKFDLYREKYGDYFKYNFFYTPIYVSVETKSFPCPDRVNIVTPMIEFINDEEEVKASFFQTIVGSNEKCYSFEEYVSKFCVKNDGKYYYIGSQEAEEKN